MEESHHDQLTKAMSVAYLGMAAVGVLIGIYIHHLSFGWEGPWLEHFATVLLGAGTLICTSLFLESALIEFKSVEIQLSTIFAPRPWYLIVYYALIAAIGEECFLRLALQPWSGPFFAALIYALFNFDGARLMWTLWMFTAALLLGWIYQQSDQILVTIMIHFFVNLFGLSRMKLGGIHRA